MSIKGRVENLEKTAARPKKEDQRPYTFILFPSVRPPTAEEKAAAQAKYPPGGMLFWDGNKFENAKELASRECNNEYKRQNSEARE
jgi:hypothetical protein